MRLPHWRNICCPLAECRPARNTPARDTFRATKAGRARLGLRQNRRTEELATVKTGTPAARSEELPSTDKSDPSPGPRALDGREPASPRRVRVPEDVSKKFLASTVVPVYPVLARQARIQGKVVLDADISKDGTVETLKAVSGHPLLVPAALNAVKQWRYKPYVLNGKPVPVNTQIVVNFTLKGRARAS